MKLYKILGFAGLTLSLAIGGTSCKKSFLDVKPSNQAVLEDVFTTVEGARSVINGMHRRLYESDDHDQFGMPSINLVYELMSEDLGMQATGSGWFVTAARYTDARNGDAYQWSIYYQIVNNANFVIQNIDNATGSDGEKAEVKAQAYAYRAWAYLQLLQCYQFAYNNAGNMYVVGVEGQSRGAIGPSSPTNALGVPLYTEPTKEGKPRASMREVLNQIDADLEESIALFNTAGVPARSDKSQININVAKGFAARSKLYQQRWTEAAQFANEARQGLTLMVGPELLNGFNSVSNKEWMWGFVINAEQNGIYASLMSHMDVRLAAYGKWAQKQVSNALFSGNILIPYLVAIPETDARKGWWVNTIGAIPADYVRRSQLKFYAQGANSFLADYPMMRVAEMYLIEAEAKAHGNDLAGARTVLTEFATTRDASYGRADSMLTKNDLVYEIWRQRRIELWGEGFRFFDAKRQMAQFVGVTSLDKIDRSVSGFNRGVIGSANMTIPANDPRLNFRIPGGETSQNRNIIQNP